MDTLKSHPVQHSPNTNWVGFRKLSNRLSMSLALSVSLILCWCSKKEESVSATVTETAPSMTEEEKNIATALTIIDNYLGRERTKIPEYTQQETIFINNIIQFLWGYEWDELIEQAQAVYKYQKDAHKPVPFPFDPNWCDNARDFVWESKKYLSTLWVYLTWQCVSQGIYEYDIIDKNLQCAGKPIRKIVISYEENVFEWRVIPDSGVILLNLQALATNVFINKKIGFPPEAMIWWVIANELWNCEFYTDYDTSQFSQEDAFRLSEAYSTLKTLKSYENFSTIGNVLILAECINSHLSAIIWFDAWAWVDYSITHECILRAHKEMLSLYAQEYPNIAAIFETNDETIKEKIHWVQRSLIQNPERYGTLGKKFLEKYEQAFRDACRGKQARLKK